MKNIKSGGRDRPGNNMRADIRDQNNNRNSEWNDIIHWRQV